jgi:hypothetical protein
MAAPKSVRDGSDTAQSDTLDDRALDASGVRESRAGECSAGRHRLRVMGYLLGSRPVWLDCDKPLRVVCRDCDHETRWRCDGHRSSRCKPCSARYRRRVGRVASSGTSRQTGFQYLLTLTAPGARFHRMPSGDACPCTPPGGVDLPRWNASHSARWNTLRTNLRRQNPGLEFFRGVEVQARGALHDHAMVWSPTPLRKRDLAGLALSAGFGHSLDLAECPPGSKRAAYYVSKYVTKATDSRHEVPWWGQVIDYGTGEVTEGVVDGRYRTWSMSRGWGLTMAAVRSEARAFVAELEARNAFLGMGVLLAAFPDAVLDDIDTPPPRSP